jgi:uncharacterized protein (DUF433 family)
MNTLAIEHIVSDPGKYGGKPYIAGKGIKVQFIATLHNAGWTVDDLTEEYELTPGQVHAALSYYYDHKQEIDQAILESEARVQGMANKGQIKTFGELKRRIETRSTGG